jgi:hypothetical protein
LRTTSGPEVFHRHYNEQFLSAYPTIFMFLDVLQHIQTTTNIKCRGIETTVISRRSRKGEIRLFNVSEKVRTEENDRPNFVKAICYTFAVRTDL